MEGKEVRDRVMKSWGIDKCFNPSMEGKEGEKITHEAVLDKVLILVWKGKKKNRITINIIDRLEVLILVWKGKKMTRDTCSPIRMETCFNPSMEGKEEKYVIFEFNEKSNVLILVWKGKKRRVSFSWAAGNRFNPSMEGKEDAMENVYSRRVRF